MAETTVKLVSQEALLRAAEGLVSPEVAVQLWAKLCDQPAPEAPPPATDPEDFVAWCGGGLLIDCCEWRGQGARNDAVDCQVSHRLPLAARYLDRPAQLPPRAAPSADARTTGRLARDHERPGHADRAWCPPRDALLDTCVTVSQASHTGKRQTNSSPTSSRTAHYLQSWV